MYTTDRALLQPITNYKNFSYDKSNRTISEAHWERIAESIQTLYLLDLFPILTDENNVIKDGQHRFNAARLNEVPFYQIVSSMTISDVARANSITVKISADQFSECCAKMGLRSYEWVESIKRQTPVLKAKRISALNNCPPDAFVNFNFVANRPDYTEEVARIAADIQEVVMATRFVYAGKAQSNLLSVSDYLSAIQFLAGTGSYNHDRMMARLRKNPTRLLPVKGREDALTVLSAIYNINAKEEDRVDFFKLKRDRIFPDRSIESTQINPIRGLAAKYPVKIETSLDHASFKLSPYRRFVTPASLQKMCEEVKRANWLQYFPIVVDESLMVLDGQRRFHAAKELGLPIHFIKARNVTFPMLLSAGSRSLSWSVSDYGKHYSEMGMKSYIDFLNFSKEYDIPKEYLIYCAHDGSKYDMVRYNEFKTGDFKFEVTETVRRWAKFFNDLDLRTRKGLGEVVPGSGITFLSRQLARSLYQVALHTRSENSAILKEHIGSSRFWNEGRFQSKEFVNFALTLMK